MATTNHAELTDDDETYPIPSGEDISDPYLREAWQAAVGILNADAIDE